MLNARDVTLSKSPKNTSVTSPPYDIYSLFCSRSPPTSAGPIVCHSSGSQQHWDIFLIVKIYVPRCSFNPEQLQWSGLLVLGGPQVQTYVTGLWLDMYLKYLYFSVFFFLLWLEPQSKWLEAIAVDIHTFPRYCVDSNVASREGEISKFLDLLPNQIWWMPQIQNKGFNILGVVFQRRGHRAVFLRLFTKHIGSALCISISVSCKVLFILD